MVPLTADDLEKLDQSDRLRSVRDQFELSPDVVYLDGNSLGPLPKATPARLEKAIRQEWGKDLINSWNKHNWVSLPLTIGAKLAKLVGAGPDEVACCDSVSVNLYKVLSAALELRPDRMTILTEESNFPTDTYIIQGLMRQLGNHHTLRFCDPTSLEHPGSSHQLDDSVAVVLLSHVNYVSGRLLDMAAVTSNAYRAGALTIWDTAHSAGALPVDLGASGADFAVGCGYKYLNGGPGAPGWVYVARQHQAGAQQPLSGWFGHAAPFDFERNFRPAEGIRNQLCGTPPILSMIALEVGVDLACQVPMKHVRDKSNALIRVFLQLTDERLASHGFSVASPRDPSICGSQVCLRHSNGYPIMQALVAHKVIGDFRSPDILRFGFCPLYTCFVDVWRAVEVLCDVMVNKEWDQPEFHKKKAVT
ncbi:hypothetical protein WJX74_006131 [Apatococcus lobatus]|uniref:Kynureninase n=1 Tax=Apatococcus lobatus TaxID=904363 RepID=A0AAW1QIQ7_9CHLO